MRIKEVTKLLGIGLSTLRHFERIGLIKPPARDRNDHRRYTERDVEEIRRVLYARKERMAAAPPGVPPASASPRSDRVTDLLDRFQRGKEARRQDAREP
jgi:hypothetical protein